MILAAWLLSLPFRLLAALGLRRTVILACLFTLAVTGYGVAQDLGLVEAPAEASPSPPKPAAGCRPMPTRAATADVPRSYLRLYCQAGARYRVPWPVLAAIGKVESDHGRARLPGVRSGLNRYRDRQGRLRSCCAGPMQFNLADGPPSTWRRHGRGDVYDPADAIPAAARKLVADGARRDLDRALFAYNHSRSYVDKVKQLARRYASRGSGRR
jgi:Transglycosylase SLT domain